MKLLEENIGKLLHSIDLNKDFKNLTSKVIDNKSKSGITSS
jgi:hypothetical protein